MRHKGHGSEHRFNTPKRESLMERRLRVARGKADTDDMDNLDDVDDLNDFDTPTRPARPGSGDGRSADHNPSQRRESMMERRLRVARGKTSDNDDEHYQGYHTALPDYDQFDEEEEEEYRPRRRRQSRSAAPPAHSYIIPINNGSNWFQSLLYLLLGILALVFIVLVFFSDHVLNGVKQRITGSVPQVSMPLAQPTPTMRTDAPTVLQRVQRLNRLETTSYTFEKVIEGSVQGNALQNLLMGDRLLLIAHGTVIAGIDLNKLTLEDITVSEDGTAVTITLPEVEIFSNTLDNSRTRVVSREQGLLAAANPELETKARQVAGGEILNAACESGIMQRATEDSQRAMEQFLGLLDVQHVEVLSAPAPPCPDMTTLNTTP